MEISSIAALATAQAQTRVQAEASVKVLRMALDTQQQNAMQLLEALPQTTAAAQVGSSAGGLVDTWA